MSDDPRCPSCHERGHLLGTTAWSGGGETTYYLCPRCNTHYEEASR